jgi:hypothetical protein
MGTEIAPVKGSTGMLFRICVVVLIFFCFASACGELEIRFKIELTNESEKKDFIERVYVPYRHKKSSSDKSEELTIFLVTY